MYLAQHVQRAASLAAIVALGVLVGKPHGFHDLSASNADARGLTSPLTAWTQVTMWAQGPS